MERSRVVNR